MDSCLFQEKDVENIMKGTFKKRVKTYTQNMKVSAEFCTTKAGKSSWGIWHSFNTEWKMVRIK